MATGGSTYAASLPEVQPSRSRSDAPLANAGKEASWDRLGRASGSNWECAYPECSGM